VNVSTIITAAARWPSQSSDSLHWIPKNLISIEGSYILQRSVESYSIEQERTTVVLNEVEENEFQTSQHMRRSHPHLRFRTIPSNLDGALISALFALEGLDDAEPLIVAPGDSEISGGIASHIAAFMDGKAHAGTLVFQGSGDQFSYLDLDPNGNVRQVVEKQQVSNFASTGVFYFGSTKSFREAAKWCLVNNARVGGKFYVSTALNYLIHEGFKIQYSLVEGESFKRYPTHVEMLKQIEEKL
jgi:dTDP-glucose pyrophosphorylase